MANFPQDPFDEVPADLKRVGAHRAPRKRGRGAIAFAWAALATGVLVVGGLYGLSRVNPDISFELPNFGGGDDPVASPSPAAVDGAAGHRPDDGDQRAEAEHLGVQRQQRRRPAEHRRRRDQGGRLARTRPASTPTSARSRPTTVYYSSRDYEGIARGLLQLLGVRRHGRS